VEQHDPDVTVRDLLQSALERCDLLAGLRVDAAEKRLAEVGQRRAGKAADEALRAGAALRDAEIPFMLGGGLAVWARGGARTEHDVDFLVKPEDAERAQEALVAAGMRPERPPEGWLLKAWDGDVLVDLVFQPIDGPIEQEAIDRADELNVMAMNMRVARLEDVMTSKLLALKEQEPDFGQVIELARSCREQIDWDEVRDRTQSSPMAKAFFTLVEELGVAPRAA
jgi:hypothetical protein